MPTSRIPVLAGDARRVSAGGIGDLVRRFADQRFPFASVRRAPRDRGGQRAHRQAVADAAAAQGRERELKSWLRARGIALGE